MSVDIEKSTCIEGWMQREELAWLGEQAMTKNLIVEIGSYQGRSTRVLGDNTPGKVFAVDDWFGPRSPSDKKPDGSDYSEADRKKLFTQFSKNMKDLLDKGKVIAVQTDYNALEELKVLDVRPDFVFIDGDHEYNAVVRDIKLWKKRMKPGGLLCGHDSNYGPVAQAVRDTLGEVAFAPQTTIWHVTI